MAQDAVGSLSTSQPRLRLALNDVVRLRLVSGVVLLAAYELLARSGLLYSGVVPSLVDIGSALIDVLANPEFYSHLGVTAFEVALGFAIGGISGLIVGICFGLWNFLGRTFEPWIHNLASTPKIIFLPIMFLLFGVGIGSKVAMGAIASFFPVAISIYSAMRLVRPVYIHVMESFNASRLQTVILVYLPSLVAPALASMRIAFSVAIVSTLLAEIKMARAGIGYIIIQDYNFFRIPEMYAVLIVIFALSWIVNMGIGRLALRYHS
jgi:ABC-type nitrate/sulfonate/bicarbonate transport system permease component